MAPNTTSAEVTPQEKAIQWLNELKDHGASIEALEKATEGDTRAGVQSWLKRAQQEAEAADPPQREDNPPHRAFDAPPPGPGELPGDNDTPPEEDELTDLSNLSPEERYELLLADHKQHGGPLPERFAVLVTKGAPRIAVLKPTEKVADELRPGRVSEIGGIMYNAQVYNADRAIRVIDVKDMEATRRPNHRISKAEAALRIMATDYFQASLILTWEEYEERKRLEAEKVKEMERVGKAFENKLAAKRGKRGYSLA